MTNNKLHMLWLPQRLYFPRDKNATLVRQKWAQNGTSSVRYNAKNIVYTTGLVPFSPLGDLLRLGPTLPRATKLPPQDYIRFFKKIIHHTYL